MLNYKADFELRNCPLCGSDKIAMIGEQQNYYYGYSFANADIECFSCGTKFILKGKNKEEIIDLWNGKRLGNAEQGKHS